jgi:hypothetical protein
MALLAWSDACVALADVVVQSSKTVLCLLLVCCLLVGMASVQHMCTPSQA